MNNYVHESVGGQRTAIDSIDVQGIVKSVNYKNIIGIDTQENLSRNILWFLENDGPSFLEIRLKPGSRTELGRPTIKPIDNKRNLIEFLQNK